MGNQKDAKRPPILPQQPSQAPWPLVPRVQASELLWFSNLCRFMIGHEVRGRHPCWGRSSTLKRQRFENQRSSEACTRGTSGHGAWDGDCCRIWRCKPHLQAAGKGICMYMCMYVCMYVYIYVPVGQVKRLRYLVILRFHAWLKNVCGGWLSLPPSQVVISRFERWNSSEFAP